MRMLRTGVRAVAASVVAVLLLTVPAIGADRRDRRPRPTSSIRLRPTPTSRGTCTRTGTTSCTRSSSAARGSASTPRGPRAGSAASRAPRSIYQQWNPSKGTSDIYSYDLVAKTRTKIGKPVSTGGWDYDPTGSGDWVMYARYYRNADRKIFLYNTNTHDLRRRGVDVGSPLDPALVADQRQLRRMGEDRAPARPLAGCNVFLYDIAGETTTKLANPNARCQYSPAVNPAGTVFFARSGLGLREERRAAGAGARELGHQLRDARGRARRLLACTRSTTATRPPTSTTTRTSAAGKANIVKVTEP